MMWDQNIRLMIVKTLRIGVGTVPYKYRTDENKDYKKPNYYIEYKFRKRYKDFSEIFSFQLLKYK